MFNALQSLFEDPAFKSAVKHALKTFTANKKILKEGKPHEYLYIIKKGSVRVYVSADMGEQKSVRPGIADLGPDDIFGEFGLFDDSPASADVSALTDTEVMAIEIKSFRSFLDANPEIGYKLFRAILQTFIGRLRHANLAVSHLFAYGIKTHQLDKYLE